MYSQSEEEKHILEFFKDKPAGRLLEIGAYHPTVFSNSRALIEVGWGGLLVEPSPKCFSGLEEFYKDSDVVDVVNVAIGSYDGKLKFHDSGGANATAIEEHYKLWKDVQLDYEDVEVDCVTWDTFYRNFPGIYNFVSIDAEGMDYLILRQMNLTEMRTDLVCVEYTYYKQEIFDFLNNSGLTKLLHYNGENIIMGRV